MAKMCSPSDIKNNTFTRDKITRFTDLFVTVASLHVYMSIRYLTQQKTTSLIFCCECHEAENHQSTGDCERNTNTLPRYVESVQEKKTDL